MVREVKLTFEDGKVLMLVDGQRMDAQVRTTFKTDGSLSTLKVGRVTPIPTIYLVGSPVQASLWCIEHEVSLSDPNIRVLTKTEQILGLRPKKSDVKVLLYGADHDAWSELILRWPS